MGDDSAAATGLSLCLLLTPEVGESGASSNRWSSIDLRLMPIGNIYEW